MILCTSMWSYQAGLRCCICYHYVFLALLLTLLLLLLQLRAVWLVDRRTTLQLYSTTVYLLAQIWTNYSDSQVILKLCHQSDVYSSRVIFSKSAFLFLYTLPYDISVQSPIICINSHYRVRGQSMVRLLTSLENLEISGNFVNLENSGNLKCTQGIFGAHYYQRQKCRPVTLVSENIRFMQIFTGVPLGGASNDIQHCARNMPKWLSRSRLFNTKMYVFQLLYNTGVHTWSESDNAFQRYGRLNFYRTMHFSAKHSLVIACRLSVRPSVCDVGGSGPHRLENLGN